MNRRALVPSLFLPLATMLGGVSILLAGGAAAEHMPDPPPICDVSVEPPGSSCLPGAHADYYWPRDCPKQNLAPYPGNAYRLHCRAPADAPIPAIFCSPTRVDNWVCEGEPRALDGTLTYTWSAQEGLTITEPTDGDPAVVEVACSTDLESGERFLTLAVSSANGTTATITGPLKCLQGALPGR